MTNMEEIQESSSDAVYKWTVRSLYLCAIGLNLWYLVEQYRSTPEGQVIQERTETLLEKLRRPFRERKHFRRMVNETIVEAWITVDDANKQRENEE